MKYTNLLRRMYTTSLWETLKKLFTGRKGQPLLGNKNHNCGSCGGGMFS